MIVLEHPTESLAAIDLANGRTEFLASIDERVARAQMVALGMIMRQELIHFVGQRTLAKEDHLSLAFAIFSSAEFFDPTVRRRKPVSNRE